MIRAIVKKLLDIAVYLFLASSIIFTIFLFSTLSPQIKDNITRYWMYESVVHVSVPANSIWQHHGTGFHVEGKSGKSYILTVDHVCMHETDNTALIRSDVNSKNFYAKIIARDPDNDLCLLPAYQADALTLPLKPIWFSGEHSWAYGYPGTTNGLYAQFGELLILKTGRIDMQTTSEKLCKKGGGIFTSWNKKCTKYQKNLIYTSYTSEPGLSGGPVINLFGQVLGMNIARTHKYNYGIMVPSATIVNFLSKY